MKKRYFSFIFAFVLLVPCMLLLTACGGKKVSSITIDNMFVGEKQDVYEYGTSINDIISTDLTVTARYDDNSTKVLNSDEYKIEFFKDSQKVEKIKDLPDVGYYSIRVSYDIVTKESSFWIIPSENPYYTVSLFPKSWVYGEDIIPTVTLANYDLQEGDIVSYYYIEKSEFDSLDEQEKKDPSSHAFDWAYVADGTTTLDAGQYYVFANISFVNSSNYTGLTVIDLNSLITVNRKNITVTPDDAAGVKALEFDYNNSGASTSGGDYHIGDITLDDITLENYGANISGVEGYFDWANPDQTLNASNNGWAYPIVFIPDYSNNYEAVYSEGELKLTVSVKKGIVGDSNEMKIYFENTNEETTILYDGQEHSVLLNNHFDIHNAGGKLKNIVTFKNQNGEDVAVRYEELAGGSDALYIDGLKEIGTYQFTVSIVDTANYCWEDGTTAPITFSVEIVGNSDLLDVEGDYQPVNPETDGASSPQPDYMEFIGRWMETGMETTASDYDAQIQIDYKDQNQTFKITGNLNNKYNDEPTNDEPTYNDFITNTTLTDGKDSYVISGKVDTSGLDNGYTVTKNGEVTEGNCVINENLHSLIMEALRIDLANNSMSSEEQIWSVAQDSENLKIKVEINLKDEYGVIVSVTVVHFVFDAEGNFVGHKVSMTSVDGTMSYSIQMKLVK